MQKVVCPSTTVNSPKEMPSEGRTVLKAELSATPVMIPGSASGRMNEEVDRVATEEVIPAHREGDHRAEDRASAVAPSPALTLVRNAERTPVVGRRPCATTRVDKDVGGHEKPLAGLKELTTTTISGR